MRILFVGPYSPPISGPAVKNSIMFDWLNKGGSKYIFNSFNTHDFRERKILSILKSILLFITTKRIILSVSKNGRFLFIPICYLFRKKVILFPAGGSFDEEINELNRGKKHLFLKCCKCLQFTFSQTNNLKLKLEELGFRNVLYFPNPRKNKGFEATVYPESNVFKVIYLSKIRKGKGPLLLAEAVKVLNNKYSDKIISLDFYGLIDKEFEEEFFESIDKNTYINYKGVTDAEEVQQTISKYNLFVLPSMFPEGVPGAVIEAMFTGIPIIISNFTAAKDLIDHNKEGIIIPQNDFGALVLAMEEILLNENKRSELSLAVSEKAGKFDFDLMMRDFVKTLETSEF